MMTQWATPISCVSPVWALYHDPPWHSILLDLGGDTDRRLPLNFIMLSSIVREPFIEWLKLTGELGNHFSFNSFLELYTLCAWLFCGRRYLILHICIHTGHFVSCFGWKHIWHICSCHNFFLLVLLLLILIEIIEMLGKEFLFHTPPLLTLSFSIPSSYTVVELMLLMEILLL